MQYAHYLFLGRFGRCWLGWLPGQKKRPRMISSERYNRSSRGTNRNSTLASLEHTYLFLSYLSCWYHLILPSLAFESLPGKTCCFQGLGVFRTTRVLVTSEHCWERKINSLFGQIHRQGWVHGLGKLGLILENSLCSHVGWPHWEFQGQACIKEVPPACGSWSFWGRDLGEHTSPRIGLYWLGAWALNHTAR